MDLNEKNVMITGATSGIGRVTALDIAGRGPRLILPVRNMEKGEVLKNDIQKQTGNTQVELMHCDLASMNSIRQFAADFIKKHDRLHLLVNNAGLWEVKRKESADHIEMNFAVNHLAPFLLTMLLLPVIKRSAPARIVNVSSTAHKYGSMRFNDLEGKKRWGSMQSYAQSKLANILFTRKLAAVLEGSDVTVNCLHPGVVSTRLFDNMPGPFQRLFSLFMISPEKGAQTSIYLATSPEVDGVTGEYFARRRIARTSSQARDMKAADMLWDISKEYCGL
ncbi:MAG: SDR family oxidoreductase [Bacteroidales bacterium]|nr:SDR family oxidoreductase [Bacteroidales bacterium]